MQPEPPFETPTAAPREASTESLPEAWMRGPLPGVSPFLAPTLFSFQQAREDLAVHTNTLSQAQLWARPFGFAPAAFHVRHIGRSADRLTTYLKNQSLTPDQLGALRTEMVPGASREEVLAELEQHLRNAEIVIRNLNVQTLDEPRGVGRRRLPTTVVGLLVHLAEHTQRHVGQAIAAAKLARIYLPEAE